MMLWGATIEIGVIESIVVIIGGIAGLIGTFFGMWNALSRKIDRNKDKMESLQRQIMEMKGFDLKQQFQIETLWKRVMRNEEENGEQKRGRR